LTGFAGDHTVSTKDLSERIESMKIAVVSKADAKGGGASKVAVDLAEGLASRGHDILHLVSWSSRGYGPGLENAYGRNEATTRKAHGFLRRIGAGELVGVDTRAVMGKLAGFKPDVVHIHDTSGCFSIPLLRAVATKYRTFWTFHDCSPFTGGCLYDMGCSRLVSGCGDCPRTGEWPIDGIVDLTARRYAMKHSLLGEGRIRTVAPSDWIADHSIAWGGLSRRPQVVSNGVKTDVFKRIAEDRHLETGAELRIILSAGSLADARKGIRHAVAVVRAISRNIPCSVGLIGNPDNSIEQELSGIPFEALGFVSGEEAMARALGAGDAFLLCSLADNQPLAVLEALSMGMVVGAYASGGVAGMIHDGENGLLAPAGHPEVLASKFIEAHAAGRFDELQKAARLTAVNKHSMELFITSHESMYTESF
jgi:glycosyltransferase involved in cell wall biosynthesis